MATPPINRAFANSIGTSPVTVFTANTIQHVTVIGMTLSNKLGTATTAKCELEDSTPFSVELFSAVPVEPTNSLTPFSASEKLVLIPGDKIIVTAGDALALDVCVSYYTQDIV